MNINCQSTKLPSLFQDGIFRALWNNHYFEDIQIKRARIKFWNIRELSLINFAFTTLQYDLATWIVETKSAT